MAASKKSREREVSVDVAAVYKEFLSDVAELTLKYAKKCQGAERYVDVDAKKDCEKSNPIKDS